MSLIVTQCLEPELRFRIPIRSYELCAALNYALTKLFRIPIRSYEDIPDIVDALTGMFRIPIRSYEVYCSLLPNG